MKQKSWLYSNSIAHILGVLAPSCPACTLLTCLSFSSGLQDTRCPRVHLINSPELLEVSKRDREAALTVAFWSWGQHLAWSPQWLPPWECQEGKPTGWRPAHREEGLTSLRSHPNRMGAHPSGSWGFSPLADALKEFPHHISPSEVHEEAWCLYILHAATDSHHCARSQDNHLQDFASSLEPPLLHHPSPWCYLPIQPWGQGDVTTQLCSPTHPPNQGRSSGAHLATALECDIIMWYYTLGGEPAVERSQDQPTCSLEGAHIWWQKEFQQLSPELEVVRRRDRAAGLGHRLHGHRR